MAAQQYGSGAQLSARQKTLALFTLIIALVLEIVDMTIVNTALPAIKASLGADTQASQWIVAGYSLAFALLLMAGGRMGFYGYRRMFIVGVVGFTLASGACGLAATGAQLVAARLLQGAQPGRSWRRNLWLWSRSCSARWNGFRAWRCLALSAGWRPLPGLFWVAC
jgi:MFS family permease